MDFFAGSGTTGQAVLELNAEDGGLRRFILCSSTEATDKMPDKNLCRDVCAERLRRVIAGYAGKSGYSLMEGGEFAYLQLDKLESADVTLDATADHVTQLLAMRHAAAVPVAVAEGALRLIARGPDWLLVLCPTVSSTVMQTLSDLPAQQGVARLIVYAPRPRALAAWLAERGVEAQVHPLRDALVRGQGVRK